LVVLVSWWFVRMEALPDYELGPGLLFFLDA